jgi:tRNA threonylcarbamoyladenosine modification (KEOPS) complex Cgi121 subunit
MEDHICKATAELKAWTLRVRKGEAESLLRTVSEAARETGSQVLVVKGELVFGSDHMRSALYHARKAIEMGSNSSDSVAMETLLYSSGERQLNSAIRKMSVDGETESVAVILLSGPDVKPEESWKEMPRTPPAVDLARLRKFGISDCELGTISKERADELVMERVAAVDILKK